jgi:hypothetical protein
VFRETALMRRKKTMSSNGVPDAISTERRRWSNKSRQRCERLASKEIRPVKINFTKLHEYRIEAKERII